MKFACDAGVLREAIGYLANGVMSKCTLPVLECIAIDAGENSVLLRTTNLDSYTLVTIPADVTDAGSVCVNCKTLQKFVIGDGVIEFETDDRAQQLHAGCGLESLETPFLLTEDFPEFDPTAIVAGLPLTLNALQFVRDLRLVASVASTDDSRPTLKSIQIREGESKLHLAATDGFQLLVINRTDRKDSDHLIYSSLLLALAKIIDQAKTTTVSVAFGSHDDANSKDKAIVHLQSASGLKIAHCLTCVDARYPEWTPVVPKSSMVEITVDAEKLKFACDLALAYSRNGVKIVTLSLCADGRLGIAGIDPTLGDVKVELSVVSREGENVLEWACNGEYLSSYLKQFGLGNVRLSFVVANRPAMVTPVGSVEESEHFFILMPMTPK